MIEQKKEIGVSMKNLKKITFGLLGLLFVSCATTLNVDVPRAAEVDLNGAKSIAIEPILVSKYVKSGNLTVTRNITDYLEKTLESELTAGGYYKIIGPRDRRTPADIYLDCEIVIFDVDDDSYTTKVKNPKYQKPNEPRTGDSAVRRPVEPEYIHVTKYKRKVRFIFKYEFVDGYTEKVLHSKEIEMEYSSSETENYRNLEDPYNMVKNDLRKISTQIIRSVQPYTVTRSMTLLDVKKNEDMEYANKLADKGYYQDSYNEFMRIYNETGLMEAGYNAAVVLEAMGRFVEAQRLMTQVYDNSWDKRAKKELDSINDEISKQRKFNDQNKKR